MGYGGVYHGVKTFFHSFLVIEYLFWNVGNLDNLHISEDGLEIISFDLYKLSLLRLRLLVSMTALMDFEYLFLTMRW